MNGIHWNIGLLIEFTKSTVKIGFTSYATTLWKSPFGLRLFGRLLIQEFGKINRIKHLLGVIVLRKMVFNPIPPELHPQAIKGLRTKTPLFALGHILEKLVHLLRVLTIPFASQKFGVGHAVLSPNHENLGISTSSLHKCNPARNDGLLAAPDYVPL